MPKGEVRVTANLILDFLMLREECFSFVDMKVEGDQLAIVVERPDLPEPKDGKLPEVIAHYQSYTTSDGHVWPKVERIEIKQ